jgi:plasmid stability protein
MATITIRNVDAALHAQLKQDAKANHRSLEAEARMRLQLQCNRGPSSRLSMADELRQLMMDPGPDYEGSVALIRAIRDEE